MSYTSDTHARHGDPDTSKDAADQLTSFGKHCRTLLEEFGAAAGRPGWDGFTAEEVSIAAGIDPWAGSKRVTDLRHMRLIQWWTLAPGVFYKRRGAAHRLQRVYDITQRGLDVLARLAAKP